MKHFEAKIDGPVYEIVQSHAKAAPVVIAIALALVFVPAWFYRMNVFALLVGPATGMLCFILFVRFWRTRNFLYQISIMATLAPIFAAAFQQSIYWTGPQTAGLAALFYMLPRWVSSFALIEQFKRLAEEEVVDNH